MISKEEIKNIRSLQLKKFRKEKEQFIIEGPKMLEEAIIHHPSSIEKIYYTEKFEQLRPLTRFQTEEVSEKVLRQLSGLKQPQHVVTVCKTNSPEVEEQPLKLVLDNIQDPGNMGTILRLAAWFNITEIIASEDCVDNYNPKVVQASMGAIFNVKITYTDLKGYLANYQGKIYGALLEGTNIYDTPIQKEGLLIMGNEGNGIRSEFLKFIQYPLHIPRFGKGESLNVAMATGIFLSEFSRSN